MGETWGDVGDVGDMGDMGDMGGIEACIGDMEDGEMGTWGHGRERARQAGQAPAECSAPQARPRGRGASRE